MVNKAFRWGRLTSHKSPTESYSNRDDELEPQRLQFFAKGGVSSFSLWFFMYVFFFLIWIFMVLVDQ